MSQENLERWVELCELAVKEQDIKKFLAWRKSKGFDPGTTLYTDRVILHNFFGKLGIENPVIAALSPRWGCSFYTFFPRLAPWAAFFRRFAANTTSLADFSRALSSFRLPNLLAAAAQFHNSHKLRLQVLGGPGL